MTDAITTLTLHFELRSAATFGRGEGLPGLLDQEVERDQYGLPYLRGRTLRGLLVEEAESLLFALGERGRQWRAIRQRLFGQAGRLDEAGGILYVGDACLPENLRRLIAVTQERDDQITPAAVLDAVTAIRRQTAMTPRGAPEAASLRAMRVILRGTPFAARLNFDEEPEPEDLMFLAAVVLAWRRAGTGRNRGRGWLKAWLEDEEWMRVRFEDFCRQVTKGKQEVTKE